jgi:ABC-type dipeptide/oligopeptide/nickel transport system permease subunit
MPEHGPDDTSHERGSSRRRSGSIGRILRTERLGVAGGLLVAGLVVMAIAAPQIAPVDPKATAFETYLPPAARNPMGTDHLGRDVLSRVVHGARLSLYVGLTSVLLAVSFGSAWGSAAAYFGGTFDMVSQRLVDVMMGYPPIILALALMAALGPSVNNVILALLLLLIPTAARTVRAHVLTLKELPYVESARAAGASHVRILVRHLLPNSVGTITVLVSVNVAYAILVEASLSFLGLGSPPDEPSWGGMLATAVRSIDFAPWAVLFPGLAMSLSVFGLNLFGDMIRDILDPRLRIAPGQES